LTTGLWTLALYLMVVYLALRFGGGKPDPTELSWISS